MRRGCKGALAVYALLAATTLTVHPLNFIKPQCRLHLCEGAMAAGIVRIMHPTIIYRVLDESLM